MAELRKSSYLLGMSVRDRTPHDYLRMVARVFSKKPVDINKSVATIIYGLNILSITGNSNSINFTLEKGAAIVNDQFIGIDDSYVDQSITLSGDNGTFFLTLNYIYIQTFVDTIPYFGVFSEGDWPDDGTSLKLAKFEIDGGVFKNLTDTTILSNDTNMDVTILEGNDSSIVVNNLITEDAGIRIFSDGLLHKNFNYDKASGSLSVSGLGSEYKAIIIKKNDLYNLFTREINNTTFELSKDEVDLRFLLIYNNKILLNRNQYTITPSGNNYSITIDVTVGTLNIYSLKLVDESYKYPIQIHEYFIESTITNPKMQAYYKSNYVEVFENGESINSNKYISDTGTQVIYKNNVAMDSSIKIISYQNL